MLDYYLLEPEVTKDELVPSSPRTHEVPIRNAKDIEFTDVPAMFSRKHML